MNKKIVNLNFIELTILSFILINIFFFIVYIFFDLLKNFIHITSLDELIISTCNSGTD